LCVASNIRAMPENEKPPARRVDVYLHSDELKSGCENFMNISTWKFR
jgi:hypothetical protein